MAAVGFWVHYKFGNFHCSHLYRERPGGGGHNHHTFVRGLFLRRQTKSRCRAFSVYAALPPIGGPPTTSEPSQGNRMQTNKQQCDKSESESVSVSVSVPAIVAVVVSVSVFFCLMPKAPSSQASPACDCCLYCLCCRCHCHCRFRRTEFSSFHYACAAAEIASKHFSIERRWMGWWRSADGVQWMLGIGWDGHMGMEDRGPGGGGCGGGGGAAFLALVHTRKCRDSQAGSLLFRNSLVFRLVFT